MSPKTIVAQVIGADHLPKLQKLGKQDPYVVVKYGAYSFKTEAIKDGGTSATWNETFSFPVLEGLNQAEFVVLNHHFLNKEEILGTVKVDLEPVLKNGSLHQRFPVFSSKERAEGSLELDLKCPEELDAQKAAKELQAMKIAEEREKYKTALAAARERRQAEALAVYGVHVAVASSLAEEALQHGAKLQLKDAAVGSVFLEAREKSEEVAGEVFQDHHRVAKTFVDEFPAALAKNAPGAQAVVEGELAELLKAVTEADAEHSDTLRSAHRELLDAVGTAVARYLSSAEESGRKYEKKFKDAVGEYKADVHGLLLRNAEARAVSDAGAAP